MRTLLPWLSSTPLGSILLLWGLLVVVNIPAPWLGLRFEASPRRVPLEPPGWVIGAAWFVLFALLGLARWRLSGVGSAEAAVGMRVIEGYALWCAAYAYYTLGLSALTGVSALVFGFVGNLLTIVFAVVAAAVAARGWPGAAWLILPSAAWTAFATAVVVQQWRAGLR